MQTILDRQVRRIEELNRDLLAFSSVEDSTRELHPEAMTFDQLGQWVEEQFTSRAEQNNQALCISTDPSRTGDIARRGTGLGLSIVKHACQRLGGSVHLKSRPGQGTTVTVQLPLAAG